MSKKTRLGIVALAPNEWQGDWKSRQHLLSRIGRQHAVVYSTGPWSVWDRVRPEWSSAPWNGRYLAIDNVQVDIAPRFLLRWPKWSLYDRAISSLHGRRLRTAPALRNSALALMLFHPGYLPYIDVLRPDVVGYHAYDLFESTPGWNDTLEAMEAELLRRAHFASTISSVAQQRLEAKGNRKVFLLPNGVDLKLFSNNRFEHTAPPADLAAIPHPRIAFTGNLRPVKVDYSLLFTLADARPGWHFVLIGGNLGSDDGPGRAELDACRRLSNIHFIETKPLAEIPFYLHHMDVNIMPYRLVPPTWVLAGHPIKLYEYLAVGKPIVTCDIETLRAHTDVLRIAAGPDEWIAGIEEALLHGGVGNVATRRAVANENGWNQRAESLEKWLLAAADSPGNS